jgi:hypothetical protein
MQRLGPSLKISALQSKSRAFYTTWPYRRSKSIVGGAERYLMADTLQAQPQRDIRLHITARSHGQDANVHVFHCSHGQEMVSP